MFSFVNTLDFQNPLCKIIQSECQLHLTNEQPETQGGEVYVARNEMKEELHSRDVWTPR